jgi:ATP diphosphatase
MRNTPDKHAPAAGSGEEGGVLDDVALALPALSRAVKLQKKAASVGFDWASMGPVFAKMKEELAELEQMASKGERARIEEEFGDLLFVVANVARHLNVDPEAALRSANAKFVRRFRRIEQWLAEQGRAPRQSSLEEMDRLWERAKAEERAVAHNEVREEEGPP